MSVIEQFAVSNSTVLNQELNLGSTDSVEQTSRPNNPVPRIAR